MATFVLVPGAWLGGWCWKRVSDILRPRQHRVFTPSLPGLGDRVHVATPDTGLESHIQDVVNLIESKNLSDVVLVGHSYAGMVVTGAADRLPDRLAHLVYLDAIVPSDGTSVFDYFSEEERRFMQEETRQHGDGWRWPLPDDLSAIVSTDGMSDRDRKWMAENSDGQPIKTFTQPLRLTRPAGDVPRTYILCTSGRSFNGLAEFKQLISSVPLLKELRAPDWRFLELDTGHYPMFSMPTQLADLLIEAVT